MSADSPRRITFMPHVQAVFLHIPVGGHVVEMLGGGDLAGEFAGKVHPVRLDQLDEPVELIGGDEGVDRIAEQHEDPPAPAAARSGAKSFS